MLAFLRLFLKFYLADTPHRRNAKHFGGGSEQLTQFHCILADTPHRRNAQHFGGGSEQLTQFHCILADTPHRRNANFLVAKRKRLLTQPTYSVICFQKQQSNAVKQQFFSASLFLFFFSFLGYTHVMYRHHEMYYRTYQSQSAMFYHQED